MSNEDVPGENRTTSPGLALAWARSTASASELAISHSAAPLQERLILSALSPINIVHLTFSLTTERRGSILHPFFYPPAMVKAGLVGLAKWPRVSGVPGAARLSAKSQA